VVEIFVDRAAVPLVASPYIPPPPPGSNYTQLSFDREIDEFVAAIREGRPPTATVEQGLEILRILDAIYRSAETGAEVRLER
jgi:predicted dehydrogenase